MGPQGCAGPSCSAPHTSPPAATNSHGGKGTRMTRHPGLARCTCRVAERATVVLIVLIASLLPARFVRADEQGEDGQWTMPGKNYALTRYSGLDQIKIENAKNLQPAWTFSTGVVRGQEAAPLVVGKTMYVVTPFPNILYALNLDKAAKKESPLKWKYEPAPQAAAQGVACCD